MTKTNLLRNISVALVASLLLSTTVLSVTTGAIRNGQPVEVAARIAERRTEALARIVEKRENGQKKSTEARTKACETRKEKVASSMNRISNQANRLIGVMDSFYEKAQGFYDKGQLTIANYEELSAAVTTARQTAVLEVTSLSELDAEIDCDNPDVAVNVAVFKDSTQAARTALRDYRTSLVALISSMRAAAATEKEAANNEETAAETNAEETAADTEEEGTTNE